MQASSDPVGPRRGLSRRRLFAALGGSALALLGRRVVKAPRSAAAADSGGAPAAKALWFRTRGVVIAPSDAGSWPWPAKAKAAGLTTIALHATPSQTSAFVKSDPGQAFLEECRKLGLEVECEQHAFGELLPRALFAKDPAMFRMDDKGRRVQEANLCVSSPAAIAIVRENAVKLAEVLRPTTGRYFYWLDDGQPMCRCPKCRELSDTEQALLVENEMLKALRKHDRRATLAHLCYHNTLKPPAQVKPESGVFLEFAPIARKYDQPLSRRDIPSHGEFLDVLDANLAVFGSEGAQALEYWLDVSRFSGWKRGDLTKIPWDAAVYRDDLATYAQRGIRHVTTFAVWLDAAYVGRFGEPPLAEYGEGLVKTVPT